MRCPVPPPGDRFRDILDEEQLVETRCLSLHEYDAGTAPTEQPAAFAAPMHFAGEAPIMVNTGITPRFSRQASAREKQKMNQDLEHVRSVSSSEQMKNDILKELDATTKVRAQSSISSSSELEYSASCASRFNPAGARER